MQRAPLAKRQLGRTGLALTQLGMGTAPLGDLWERIPEERAQATFAAAWPERAPGAHKGTFGTLLILGGSVQMIGAPMLAARSAYRAGCGLVVSMMVVMVVGARVEGVGTGRGRARGTSNTQGQITSMLK